MTLLLKIYTFSSLKLIFLLLYELCIIMLYFLWYSFSLYFHSLLFNFLPLTGHTNYKEDISALSSQQRGTFCAEKGILDS